MWTKKNDYAPKSKCADFFECMPKKGNIEKKFKFDHSLGLHLSSLVECVEKWFANPLTTIFTKKMSD